MATLGTLAALAWFALVRSSSAPVSDAPLTMGMDALLFVATWTVMMVATMFPATAPMAFAFARVQAERRRRGRTLVPTWLFLAGYLLVWSAVGALAYVIALAAESLGRGSPWIAANAPAFAGAALVAAGLYQCSPLKRACLSACRTPLGFVLSSWREGRLGAVRMGGAHARYCVGCCWLLFVALFPLGMTNLAALALVAGLILVEKTTPRGEIAGAVAGLALVTYGLAILADPSLLPRPPMSDGGMGY